MDEPLGNSLRYTITAVRLDDLPDVRAERHDRFVPIADGLFRCVFVGIVLVMATFRGVVAIMP
jgi:hypothetical protein